MSIRLKSVVLMVPLVVAGCRGAAATPTQTPGDVSTPTIVPFQTAPPPTATPAPAWFGTGCDPTDIVVAMRSTVPYAEFSLSHNYLYAAYHLNAWVVDTSLDPLAEGAQLTEDALLAARHAAALAYDLNLHDACVSQVFDQIVVMVVDPDYNTWFLGSIDPADLSTTPMPSDVELDRAIAVFTPGYSRSAPSASVGRTPPGEQTCLWSEVRPRLEAVLGTGQENLAFYLTADENGVSVMGQWAGPPDFNVFLPQFLAMADELRCLYPALDTFWAIHVDGYGGTQLIVAEPGEAIRDGNPTTLLEQLEVIYPQNPQ